MSNNLKSNFEVACEIYSKRGFQNRIGYGKKPAIVNVDLANAWTREGSPFTCYNMDEVVANVNKLLDVARTKNVPIFFFTTAYESNMIDSGIWAKKISVLKEHRLGSERNEIDSRLNPGKTKNEIVIVKKMASVFFETGLNLMLTALGVDTVIITGVTASACIRATVQDAVSYGFRPIIPEGTVSDRIPGAVEYNLFDLDAKFGDVESMENVIEYLEKFEG